LWITLVLKTPWRLAPLWTGIACLAIPWLWSLRTKNKNAIIEGFNLEEEEEDLSHEATALPHSLQSMHSTPDLHSAERGMNLELAALRSLFLLRLKEEGEVTHSVHLLQLGSVEA